MTDKPALGKGLGALLGGGRGALGPSAGTGREEGRLRELRLDDIAVNRRQPRRSFDTEELAELAASIQALGMVQPVVVRPVPAAGAHDDGPRTGAIAGPDAVTAGAVTAGPGALAATIAAARGPRYELIAGERRLRAARLAGLEYVPALVRPADEIAALEIALAENVAREDLNCIEEAQAYAALSDEFGLTHERIGQLVGRSRVAVTNVLRLLELPDDVQRMVEQRELSEGHGRALLALPDHGQRRKAARLVVSRGLSVRQTEELVRRMNETPARPSPAAADATAVLADELYGLLQAPVRIRSGRRGGSIQIAYKDQIELDRLVRLLRSLGD